MEPCTLSLDHVDYMKRFKKSIFNNILLNITDSHKFFLRIFDSMTIYQVDNEKKMEVQIHTRRVNLSSNITVGHESNYFQKSLVRVGSGLGVSSNRRLK